MKKRLAILSLLVVALFFASLGTPAHAQGKVTIRMSTWTGVDEAKELQAILDKINASATDYQIVHEPSPSDYITKVKTQLAGGTAADLYWVGNEDMALATEGVFAPLTDCLKDAPAKSAGDVKDYYPDVIGLTTFDNVVYGLPWIAQPVVVYYNRGLFKAAGVAEPKAGWTWDDFTTTAKALTKKDASGKTSQWGFIATDWPPVQMFIWQAGGDVITADRKSSPIDSPEAIEGIKFRLSLSYNPEFSPSTDIVKDQGFGEMFKAGKVAMFMGGAADDLDRVPNLDIGVVSVPANPRTKSNATFAWTGATVIAATTKNPVQACKALLAVTEGIQNWKIVSPRISQANVEHLVASEPRKKGNAEALIAAVSSMRAFRLIPNMGQWNDAFYTKLINPLLNKETDRTVDDLAKEVRAQLEATLPK